MTLPYFHNTKINPVDLSIFLISKDRDYDLFLMMKIICLTKKRNWEFMIKKHTLHLLVLAALSALAQQAIAQEKTQNNEAVLDSVTVVGKTRADKQGNITTIRKNQEDLHQKQVNDIRDITRYDPGISVNEQGQGGSAGYSIRGVDRNRVSVVVDNLPQAQVFSPSTQYDNTGEFGGTVNEIEVENIKAVTITKGANSASVGSGAMGGSVVFKTKDPDDVIEHGKNYGIRYKTGYTTKDRRFVNSLAIAGRLKGFEGLLQYTHRKGHEIQSHSKTGSKKLRFYYDPTPGFKGAGSSLPYHYEQTLSADDVWGSAREVPNPMSYQSKSWFLKGGFRPTAEHYVGIVGEDTRQDYQMVDMTKNRFDPYLRQGFTHHSTKYLRNYWQDNIHKKQRIGLEYIFNNAQKDGWLDGAGVSLDWQKISMLNVYDARACSKTLSRSCWPSGLQGQSAINNQTGTQEQQLALHLKANKTFYFGKSENNLAVFAGANDLRFTHTSILTTENVQYDYHYDHLKDKGYVRRILGGADNKVIYDDIERVYPPVSGTLPDYRIRSGNVHFPAKTIYSLQPIKGKNYYFGAKNTFKLNEYFSVPLSFRADYYSFKSSDDFFTKNVKFKAYSWGAGLEFRPTQKIRLSYQANSGFRIPSFQQIYGTQTLYGGNLHNVFKEGDGSFHFSDLKPEKSLNQELGMTYFGDAIYAKTSVYRSDYTDLIARFFDSKKKNPTLEYRNTQEAHVYGLEAQVSADLNAIISRLPEGLNATLAVSVTKAGKNNKKPDGSSGNLDDVNYIMDTIQPARWVFGLGYASPSEKWGVNGFITHSVPKKESEIKRYLFNQATGQQVESRGDFGGKSKSWTTVDVITWWKPWKNFTVRGGIYNVFNQKYTTWEAMRQLGVRGISTTQRVDISGDGIRRLSAPGRNFAITLEAKF